MERTWLTLNETLTMLADSGCNIDDLQMAIDARSVGMVLRDGLYVFRAADIEAIPGWSRAGLERLAADLGVAV